MSASYTGGGNQSKSRQTNAAKQRRYEKQQEMLKSSTCIKTALPRMLSVVDYAGARLKEINDFNHSLRVDSGTSLRRVYQTVPRHMRRRAMSHNPNRLPRNMRGAALREMSRMEVKKGGKAAEKAGVDPANVTRKSRRTRRAPRSLLLDHLVRSLKNKWLESHPWQAKRMHMWNAWGYRLARLMMDKSARACFRMAQHLCTVYDESHYEVIELAGTQQRLTQLLAMCQPLHDCLLQEEERVGNGSMSSYALQRLRATVHVASAPQCLAGRVEARTTLSYPSYAALLHAAGLHGTTWTDASAHLVNAATYLATGMSDSREAVMVTPTPAQVRQLLAALPRAMQGSAIAPVRVQWAPAVADADANAPRQCWLWVHPAASQQLLTVLTAAALVADFSAAKGYWSTRTRTHVRSLRGQLCRYSLTGPRAHAVLRSVLRPHDYAYDPANPNAPVDARPAVSGKAVWEALGNLRTPASLPAGALLALKITTPRAVVCRQPFTVQQRKEKWSGSSAITEPARSAGLPSLLATALDNRKGGMSQKGMESAQRAVKGAVARAIVPAGHPLQDGAVPPAAAHDVLRARVSEHEKEGKGKEKLVQGLYRGVDIPTEAPAATAAPKGSSIFFRPLATRGGLVPVSSMSSCGADATTTSSSSSVSSATSSTPASVAGFLPVSSTSVLSSSAPAQAPALLTLSRPTLPAALAASPLYSLQHRRELCLHSPAALQSQRLLAKLFGDRGAVPDPAKPTEDTSVKMCPPPTTGILAVPTAVKQSDNLGFWHSALTVSAADTADKLASVSAVVTERTRAAARTGSNAQLSIRGSLVTHVILVQRPGHSNAAPGDTRTRNLGCGWDVIVPAGWGSALYTALVHAGARAVSQEEQWYVASEQATQGDTFPLTAPHTASGVVAEQYQRRQQLLKVHRATKARPNYWVLGRDFPFGPDFHALCAVPRHRATAVEAALGHAADADTESSDVPAPTLQFSTAAALALSQRCRTLITRMMQSIRRTVRNRRRQHHKRLAHLLATGQELHHVVSRASFDAASEAEALASQGQAASHKSALRSAPLTSLPPAKRVCMRLEAEAAWRVRLTGNRAMADANASSLAVDAGVGLPLPVPVWLVTLLAATVAPSTLTPLLASSMASTGSVRPSPLLLAAALTRMHKQARMKSASTSASAEHSLVKSMRNRLPAALVLACQRLLALLSTPASPLYCPELAALSKRADDMLLALPQTPLPVEWRAYVAAREEQRDNTDATSSSSSLSSSSATASSLPDGPVILASPLTSGTVAALPPPASSARAPVFTPCATTATTNTAAQALAVAVPASVLAPSVAVLQYARAHAAWLNVVEAPVPVPGPTGTHHTALSRATRSLPLPADSPLRALVGTPALSLLLFASAYKHTRAPEAAPTHLLSPPRPALMSGSVTMLDRGAPAPGAIIALPELRDLQRWYPESNSAATAISGAKAGGVKAQVGKRERGAKAYLSDPQEVRRSLTVDTYLADCKQYAESCGATVVLPPTTRDTIGFVSAGRYSLSRGCGAAQRVAVAAPSLCELAVRVALGKRNYVNGGKHTYYVSPYKAVEEDAEAVEGLAGECDVSFAAVDELADVVATAKGPVIMATLPPLPVWVRAPDSQQYRPGWLVLDQQ